jgi:hypothetical protein
MSQIARYTPLVHSAYHDLLRNLKDDVVADFKGTLVKKTRAGQSFWYDTYRIGTAVKTDYIGPDTQEVRARITRFDEIKKNHEERLNERQRLIRILRTEDFLGVDAGTGSLFSALAHAGTFRLGGTIVGTHAFRLYEGELGVRVSLDQMAMTNDVDIAAFERLSLAIEDTTSPALNEVLKNLKFKALPSMKPNETWRWQQTGGKLLVEFLTPSFDKEEGIKTLPSLGVYAQSLHHLNYLIADPIAAAVTYRSGILVQIPRPERFAIHKLILADRRLGGPDAIKAHKDLMQAEFLIEILAQDRPDQLSDAYQSALNSGPQWKTRLSASLKKRPAIAKILKQLRS